jgi:hypothetical protein
LQRKGVHAAGARSTPAARQRPGTRRVDTLQQRRARVCGVSPPRAAVQPLPGARCTRRCVAGWPACGTAARRSVDAARYCACSTHSPRTICGLTKRQARCVHVWPSASLLPPRLARLPPWRPRCMQTAAGCTCARGGGVPAPPRPAAPLPPPPRRALALRRAAPACACAPMLARPPLRR